jgi:hypothetical protein
MIFGEILSIAASLAKSITYGGGNLTNPSSGPLQAGQVVVRWGCFVALSLLW